MLILRIKQAETALSDGRLDEAFELVRSTDVRAHRRGQSLVGRLVRALVSRGSEHLQADRFTQASADCDKAIQLGGNITEVIQLREAITQAVSDRHGSDRRKGDAIARARDYIDEGRLSVGEQLLENAHTDTRRVQALKADVAARRVSVEDALARARKALEYEDWDTAVMNLLEIKRSHAANKHLTELIAQVTDRVIAQAKSAINEGRVDIAESLLHRLVPLGHDTIQTRDLNRIVHQCRLAARYIARAQPRQASEILRLVAAIQPGAAWVKKALAQSQQEAEMLEELRGGPLGLLMDIHGVNHDNRSVSTMPYPDTGSKLMTEEPQNNTAGEGITSRFVMHIDGVGSFLVLAGQSITIGSARSSHNPDLGLMLDTGVPAIRIERDEADYFLESDQNICVNDIPIKRKLLADEDAVALSSRCRLKFALPNAASASAVLQIQGTRIPGSEARRVILMDREIILAPGGSAHIRCDQLEKAAVFHLRNGRLFCRSETEVLVNGRPMDRNLGITLGANVRIGDVSLVVTKM
ncbi:MAG: hypothetical protein JSV03_07810 [Planctomycetota bacterium]|nr:MAG: hypothetical protein JSV03_07810 [Planctomycetota bacterium]